jgi:regulator of protease activity HflC (stomatin/prohibitin superfamily)
MSFSLVFLGLLILTAFLSYVIVPQGTVAVVTVFGKYRRVMMPGLNFKLPFIENVYKRISIQNRSLEL